MAAADVMVGVYADANQLLKTLQDKGVATEIVPEKAFAKFCQTHGVSPLLAFDGGTGEACRQAEVPVDRRDAAVRALKEQGRIYQLGMGRGHTVIVTSTEPLPVPTGLSGMTVSDLLEALRLALETDSKERAELQKRVTVQETVIRSLMMDLGHAAREAAQRL